MKRALIVVAVFLGCAAVPIARDRFSDQMKGLAACSYAPAATLPGLWETKHADDSFTVAMPSCFQPSDRASRFVHGGSAWRCGTTTVEVVWGMWTPGSFGEKGTRCTTTVAGRRVMVVQDRRDDGPALVVWYQTGEAHEPIVSVWSSRMEDARTVAMIAFSGRLGRD